MRFEYERYGSAFLDMRLHRLRSTITEQLDVLFLQNDIGIPSTCISTILFLDQVKCANISQIAKATGYSHQLINQRLAQLESLSLVNRLEDVLDRRKLSLALTNKGKKEAKKVDVLLEQAGRLINDLYEEIEINLDRVLVAAQQALDDNPLYARELPK